MHDPASRLPRTLLIGGSVNKGKKSRGPDPQPFFSSRCGTVSPLFLFDATDLFGDQVGTGHRGEVAGGVEVGQYPRGVVLRSVRSGSPPRSAPDRTRALRSTPRPDGDRRRAGRSGART